LVQLFPQDALTDAQARWNAIDRFVEKIEELGTRAEVIGGTGFKKFEPIKAEYVKQPEIVSYEDDGVRVRIIKQKDLKEEVETTGQTVKWGQYLRGPDIYFEMLEKCADKLIPLGKVDVTIQRGITTGKNEFFYLTKEQVQHWGIEKEFLRPVIESPKECLGIKVKKEELGYYVFLCHKNKTELKGTKALRYIKWGEEQKNKDGRSWAEGETVKVRENWYDLEERMHGQILLPRVTGGILRAVMNESRIQVDDDFFEITGTDESFLRGLWGFLNTSWAFLERELKGKVNLGDGALKVDGPEWKSILVPNRELLDKVREQGEKRFQQLSGRRVEEIKKEAEMKDRIALEE
jgi:hypothetical protein